MYKMPRKVTNKRKVSEKRKSGGKRKTTYKRKSLRKRGGSGTASWAPYGGASEQLSNLGSNQPIPTVSSNQPTMSMAMPKMNGGGVVTLAPAKYGGGEVTLAPAKYGGKQQQQQQKQQQQGAGILNDIALPALLVYANNAYGRRGANDVSSRRRSSRRSSVSR